MARGEPLANTTILNDSAAFFSAMNKSVSAYNLKSKFNLSTIGPQEISDRLISEFIKPSPDVSIYYSLYSVKESFRKKWVPKSIPVHIMLENMQDWQSKGGNNVLHWSLIEGENDAIEDIDEIINLVSKYGIKAKFNLVRYNPYSDMQGKEPTQEKIEQYFNHISECLGHIDSKIVSRVGFDIKASCGMFVS
jgi:adenine C2-methylase RlmN of 23S rRNA A2503 and tRNA A37